MSRASGTMGATKQPTHEKGPVRKMLPEQVESMVAGMTTAEKRSLAEALMRMVAAETAPAEGDPSECPRCRCGRLARKGRGADGSQRWLCRGCGRTFGRKTMRVIAQSKLPRETWLAYAEGMADGLTLRQLAARCGVCLKTSWLMRMRICEAMASHLDVFRSGPGVAAGAGGTMLRESLSGNSSRGQFAMPRRARRSGGSPHPKGLSGQLACVLCAANDRGDVACELVGRAHSSAAAIAAALAKRLLPGTPVATDGLGLYAPVCEALGLEREVRPARPRAGGRALGMVNALHRRLAGFLRPFNGVATRRLGRYLAWFSWTEQYRKGGADRRELVSREALSGGYESTVRSIFAEPRFQMGYWEARGWSAA